MLASAKAVSMAAIRPSRKLCCSLAAWYSAFSLKSPWALASAMAWVIRGRSTLFNSLSCSRNFCAPVAVMGALLILPPGVIPVSG